MIIQDDPDILTWANGVTHPLSGAGSFLKAVADASVRADCENYEILRPALQAFAAKYPDYFEQERARERFEADKKG